MRPIIVQNAVIGVMAFFVICGVLIILSLHMEDPKKWGLILILVLGGITSLFLLIYPRYKKSTIFANRDSLTMDEIYTRYYSDCGLSKDVVLKLWQDIAQILRLPVGKLRPTDEFGKEMGPYRVIDDDLNELEAITFRQLKEAGAKVDFSTIKTLDDYIRYIGNIIESSRQQREKKGTG